MPNTDESMLVVVDAIRDGGEVHQEVDGGDVKGAGLGHILNLDWV